MTSHLTYEAMRKEAEQNISRHLPVSTQAVRWMDGTRHHVGRVVAEKLLGNLTLVSSFGELYLVPSQWLIKMPIRKD